MKRQKLDKNSWLTLRTTLNNSYDYNETWESVITLFKQRIEDFYFDPIEKIIAPNKLGGEGFAILTIQCALIEMFASFRLGKIYNHNKKKGGLKFEYKLADDCFINFLHSESIFQDHFYTVDQAGIKTTDTPFNAKKFYSNVRCGLMHEARTKNEWLINAKKYYDGTEKIFISPTTNGSETQFRIDRTILNKRLRDYFDKYINELKEQNNEGKKLRRFLARKLDHQYDIPRDMKFEWWKDK